LDAQQFGELTKKLDFLIRLSAANVVAGKSLTEQIEYLSSVGLGPSEIAFALGKPVTTVTGITSRLKKRAKVKEG
jgi:hypothetical protein